MSSYVPTGDGSDALVEPDLDVQETPDEGVAVRSTISSGTFRNSDIQTAIGMKDDVEFGKFTNKIRELMKSIYDPTLLRSEQPMATKAIFRKLKHVYPKIFDSDKRRHIIDMYLAKQFGNWRHGELKKRPIVTETSRRSGSATTRGTGTHEDPTPENRVPASNQELKATHTGAYSEDPGATEDQDHSRNATRIPPPLSHPTSPGGTSNENNSTDPPVRERQPLPTKLSKLRAPKSSNPKPPLFGPPSRSGAASGVQTRSLTGASKSPSSSQPIASSSSPSKSSAKSSSSLDHQRRIPSIEFIPRPTSPSTPKQRPPTSSSSSPTKRLAALTLQHHQNHPDPSFSPSTPNSKPKKRQAAVRTPTNRPTLIKQEPEPINLEELSDLEAEEPALYAFTPSTKTRLSIAQKAREKRRGMGSPCPESPRTSKPSTTPTAKKNSRPRPYPAPSTSSPSGSGTHITHKDPILIKYEPHSTPLPDATPSSSRAQPSHHHQHPSPSLNSHHHHHPHPDDDHDHDLDTDPESAGILHFLQSHTPSLEKFIPALKLTNCTLPKLKALSSLSPAMLDELWLGTLRRRCNEQRLLLRSAAMDVDNDDDHEMASGGGKGKGREDMYRDNDLGGPLVAPDDTEGILLIGHLKEFWTRHC